MAEVPVGSVKDTLYPASSDKIQLYAAQHPHAFLGVQPSYGHDNIKSALVFYMRNRFLDAETSINGASIGFTLEMKTVTEEDRVDHPLKYIALEELNVPVDVNELDIIEAEKKFLATFETDEVTTDGPNMTMIRIRQAAAKVAKKSRRGMGNVIVGNSKTISSFIWPASYGQVKQFKVEVRDYIEDDIIYVIYKGNAEFDAGAILSQFMGLEDPAHTIKVAMTTVKIVEQAPDYGVRLHIVREG